ncbi:MAG: PHP domain-containing protein [Chloroflexi bacterium]|nr:PHP domain-containing protein [Chloroflexota bacterium]
MGKAVLHVHSTYSDGLATVDEILAELEHNSDVDVVGFTDHDDVRAFFHVLEWKKRHPNTRIQPLWGIELTIAPVKHLLAYIFRPPFPIAPFRRFQPLPEAVQAIKAAGGFAIVPHVDAFWIGLGSHRVARLARQVGLDGVELLTPVLKAERSIRRVAALNGDGRLLEIGGSDAHHLPDLYKVIVDFPGHSVADLEQAFLNRTAVPRWGDPGPGVPLTRQVRQHTRALVVLPCLHLGRWARTRLSSQWSVASG